MTDLTEQWRKGELPSGWYYVQLQEGVYADNVKSIIMDYYTEFCDFMKHPYLIEQILAPVPSYEEWQEYQELDEDNKRNTQLAILFSLRADIFKELLKQSRIYVKIETEDYDDRTVSKADKEKAKELLTKIDEVLNA